MKLNGTLQLISNYAVTALPGFFVLEENSVKSYYPNTVEGPLNTEKLTTYLKEILAGKITPGRADGWAGILQVRTPKLMLYLLVIFRTTQFLLQSLLLLD